MIQVSYTRELVLGQGSIIRLDMADKHLSILQRPDLVGASEEKAVEIWVMLHSGAVLRQGVVFTVPCGFVVDVVIILGKPAL